MVRLTKERDNEGIITDKVIDRCIGGCMVYLAVDPLVFFGVNENYNNGTQIE